jgi:hypothetical protein
MPENWFNVYCKIYTRHIERISNFVRDLCQTTKLGDNANDKKYC